MHARLLHRDKRAGIARAIIVVDKEAAAFLLAQFDHLLHARRIIEPFQQDHLADPFLRENRRQLIDRAQVWRQRLLRPRGYLIGQKPHGLDADVFAIGDPRIEIIEPVAPADEQRGHLRVLAEKQVGHRTRHTRVHKREQQREQHQITP